MRDKMKNLKTIQICIEPEIAEGIEKRATKEQRTVSNMARLLIKQALEEN